MYLLRLKETKKTAQMMLSDARFPLDKIRQQKIIDSLDDRIIRGEYFLLKLQNHVKR